MKPVEDALLADVASGVADGEYSYEDVQSMAHELLCARQTLALHDDVCAKLNARIDDLESQRTALLLEIAGRLDR